MPFQYRAEALTVLARVEGVDICKLHIRGKHVTIMLQESQKDRDFSHILKLITQPHIVQQQQNTWIIPPHVINAFIIISTSYQHFRMSVFELESKQDNDRQWPIQDDLQVKS